MLHIALTFVQFFSALAIVGLVMLQRGKGAEAGAGFGAGASGTVFGARGAGTALSRATAIFTAVFMLNSLALGYVGSHHTEQPKTIFDTAAEPQQPPTAPGSRSPAASAPAQGASGSAAASTARTPSGSAPASGAAAPAAGAAPGSPGAASQAPPSAAPRAGSIPAPAPAPPGK